MASTFRIIALIFFVSPFAAMFSEPFFEAVFDIFGWNTESWAGPVADGVLMVSAYLGSPQILQILTYLAVAGFGVWAHYFATLKDRARPKDADILRGLGDRINMMALKLERFSEYWSSSDCPPEQQGRWSSEGAGMYITLENDLRRIGVNIPEFSNACKEKDWERRSNALTSFLKLILELAHHGQLKEAREIANQLQSNFKSNFPKPDGG